HYTRCNFLFIPSPLWSPHRPHRALPSFPTRRSSDLRNWVGAALSRKVRDNAVELPLPEPLTAIDTLLHEEIKDLRAEVRGVEARDRKSTRLNSSHVSISYAVFCLKKKNKRNI